MFSVGFFSVVSGVTKRPPGCWIRRRYSKVTAVRSRRLETGVVMMCPQSAGSGAGIMMSFFGEDSAGLVQGNLELKL